MPKERTPEARIERTATDSEWVDIARVVFPVDDIEEVLPLYLELTDGATVQSKGISLQGRRSVSAEFGSHVGLGTYFNAFPASYWRHSTAVRTVRLSGSFKGRVSAQIWKSSGRGRCGILTSAQCDGNFNFDISIANNVDGGFYWLEFTPLDKGGATLRSASWQAPSSLARVHGTLSIGITTFNRAPYCLRQAQTIAKDAELRGRLDKIYIVDQGTDLVSDQPGFPAVSAALGDQLTVIRQGNLGGSGGFSRAMYETLRAAKSEYVLLLDDDAILESESASRALAFADYASKPTIVGGGMLHLDQRSVLYAQGERIDFANARSSANRLGYDIDFERHPLRYKHWFHARADSDFNGWWMCLIPRKALQELGLSLPLFLKWDDLEYGVRASNYGIPTVSLPGVAVWHLAWHDKNPIRTWEEYFSHRNTWLGVLAMSPANSALKLPRVGFLTDVLQILCLQYSAVHVRNVARREVLEGLGGLHSSLGGVISYARGLRAGFDDAESRPTMSDYPPVKSPPSALVLQPRHDVRSPVELFFRAGGELLRHLFVPVRKSALAAPERTLSSPDLCWWELSGYDSALITAAEGAGFTWAKRDPAHARKLLAESLRTNVAIARAWPRLAAQVRREVPVLASPDAWEKTFLESERSIANRERPS